MYHSPIQMLQWHKANIHYLINRIPVASVGVVWSQENFDFYGRDNAAELVEMSWRGMIQALTRARIPYFPVHADHIDRDGAQLSVLALPNLAAISNEQVAAIRRFVQKGGSLIATGETSLYNEWGEMRQDFALADLFGAHVVNERNSNATPVEKLAGEVYHTYLRLYPEMRSGFNGPHVADEPPVAGKRHPILRGFEETDTIPYGGLLQPLKTDSNATVLMTFIPQFPVYPPEKAYMLQPKTDIPGLIINSTATGGRVVFLPADIDRQFSSGNLPDHGNLLKNILFWASRDDLPMFVEGAGLIDVHLYQQKERMVLHLINLTNENTWRQPLDELIPVGPLRIKIKLKETSSAPHLHTLVSNQKLTGEVSNNYTFFELKSILDHEVIVIS
jgi:hypothetical protein